MHIEIKRVCVPTDFSEPSAQALLYGATFAKTHNAELHLLHVVQDFREHLSEADFAGKDVAINTFLQALEKGATEYLARLATEKMWKDLKVERAYRFGKPAEEICRYARQHAIDLMVMGTHGRTGLKQLLLGSIVERVLRTSPCPVLTVRHPQHDFVVGEETAKLPGVE